MSGISTSYTMRASADQAAMLIRARESDDADAIGTVDNRPIFHASSRNNFVESCLCRLQQARPDPRIAYLGDHSVALSGDALASAIAGARELRDALVADPLLVLSACPEFFGDYPADAFRADFVRFHAQLEGTPESSSMSDDDGVPGSLPIFLDAHAQVLADAATRGDAAVYMLWLYGE